ncbi:MAG: aminoacyl-tRNA hydrolase [Ignavibacteriales bacterium]|nr:aminoacyl-tRNA hydrolase [Ignavibacteriales bacterium]
MIERFPINNEIVIPLSELEFITSRSGGPGGQNVNKLETRVELVFNIANSGSLRDTHKLAIREHLKSKIDGEGRLHVVSQESRSQWQNKKNAIEKFVRLLQHALKPKKKRVKTKATRQSKETRIQRKKKVGEKKKLRKVNAHEY